tara:strand:+ start:14 stop:535 length:522 start_codon:yes stop_codon:yes gene_type:complete
MYPYLRFVRVIISKRFKSKKDFNSQEEDTINLMVMPQDIDPFLELNNGRYVTLLDLGRFGFGVNVDITKFLKENNWSLTITGTFNNYRHRLRLFQRFQLKTKILGYDENWFYFFQKAVRNNKTYMASLVKFSFTSKNGIVLPKKVVEAMGENYDPTKIDDWVKDFTKNQLFKK